MHIASSTIEYIPPPGPTGPTDISITAYIHNCLPGGGIYSIIEDVVCKLYFQKTDVEAKQLWIYAVLLMSVGPVGPGGGMYSIMEDVVCKVYSRFEYIPPLGPTGPTNRQTKLPLSTIVWLQ